MDKESSHIYNWACTLTVTLKTILLAALGEAQQQHSGVGGIEDDNDKNKGNVSGSG